MTTAAIFVVIVIIFLIVLGSGKKNTLQQTISKNQNFYVSLINGLPEPGKSALARLKKAYDENLALSVREVFNTMQIPQEVGTNQDAIKQYLKITNNETAQDLYTTFFLDITQRDWLQNKPIYKRDKDKTFEQFKINIGENEILYHYIYSVEWFEEKVVRKNINYSGYAWRNSGYRFGSLSYSAQIIKDFLIQDIGAVYLTNKRVIFIGQYKNVNRSISYDKILDFKLYQDGILLGLSSSKLPVLKFSEHDNTNVNDPNDAFITNDGMNQFLRVISRILAGTQDNDLRPDDN